jgi:hypothetical protein
VTASKTGGEVIHIPGAMLIKNRCLFDKSPMTFLLGGGERFTSVGTARILCSRAKCGCFRSGLAGLCTIASFVLTD